MTTSARPATRASSSRVRSAPWTLTGSPSEPSCLHVTVLRATTHLDVSAADIERACAAIGEVARECQSGVAAGVADEAYV